MRKLIMKWMQAIKNERGYVSLTEAAATTAVGLTLAAVAAPVIINVGDDAKASRARQDTVAIQQAISKFVADVGEFPIRSTAGTQVTMPTSKAAAEAGNLNAVSCERTGSDSTNDPIMLGDCAGLGMTEGTFLNNHLAFDKNTSVTNGPGASLKYAAGGSNTPKRNWNGPYMKELQTDPWGRNYVLFTRGMHQSAVGGAQTYAWIVSAGPDGVLQTTQLHSSVQGDDIGTLAATLNAPDANFVSSTK